MVAASVGRDKNKRDGLYCLEAASSGRRITSRRIDFLEGMRVDQMLASSAFDYMVTEDERNIDDVLRQASRLASRQENLSSKEKRKFNALRKKIAKAQFFLAETSVERELQQKFIKFLQHEQQQLEAELFE